MGKPDCISEQIDPQDELCYNQAKVSSEADKKALESESVRDNPPHYICQHLFRVFSSKKREERRFGRKCTTAAKGIGMNPILLVIVKD